MATLNNVPFYPGELLKESDPWYRDAVCELYYGQGIICDLLVPNENGSADIFPAQLITREEFVLMLKNLV